MYITPVMLEFILHQSLLLFPYSHFSVLVDFRDRLNRDLHHQNFTLISQYWWISGRDSSVIYISKISLSFLSTGGFQGQIGA